MRKNYMKDLAALFGVQIGERFKPWYPNGDEYVGEYVLTSNGLVRAENTLHYCADTFICMLLGMYEVKKLPWKPQCGDVYYMPHFSVCGLSQINSYEWHDNADDKSRYAANMVCKTEDEARAKTEKMLASLKE